MAKFSQAFLQGLLRPTYEQGLFEFGKGLSMAPVLADEQRKRESMMEQLMSGSPIQQARVLQQEVCEQET
jgi:hypothetical protein